MWCPESLFEAVVAQIHYFPLEWKGKAHTAQVYSLTVQYSWLTSFTNHLNSLEKVRSELEKIFQYRAVHLLLGVLSPIITPFILYYRVRPKAQEIVDFLRQFTVEVVGVGDVCSFAQLDLNKHGHPLWQINDDGAPESPHRTAHPTVPDVKQASINFNMLIIGSNDVFFQAEYGKTELSLIHFALANPEWKPPPNSEGFLSAIRNHLQNELGPHPNIHSSCGLPGTNCKHGVSHTLHDPLFF